MPLPLIAFAPPEVEIQKMGKEDGDDEYKVSEAFEGKHDDKKEEEYNAKVIENDDDDWMEENVGKENFITLNNP